jgi:TolB-like protein/DNA-binding SARP family transcriptional activator/Flp pilus assembly protein TadD
LLVLKQLGDPAVTRAGEVLSGRAVQGRRLALLSILASSIGRPVSRDKIVGLLWPESSTDRARPQLSDSVYILRTALGDDVIHSTGDDLTLNENLISSDVADFERLLDSGEYERAVEIFSGELLEGFHLSDAAEFERWLDAERARLNQRYAAALEALALRAEKDGNFAAAVDWWRKLSARDPHSGRVALGLMRCLDAAGDRGAALKHARVHAALLQQEFEADPDSDVVALAEQLRVLPVVIPAQRVAKPDTPAPENESVRRGPTSDGDAPIPRKRARRAWAAVAVVVIAAAAIYALSAVRSEAVAPERSLAVMPFVNMSADSSGAYFSDGLSEQIISVLSRIPGLRVAARTSSFALRDSKLDIRAIGDTLNVNIVLEGSVRRQGNGLRVTAQLIDARTGYHIWSGDYDRELRQIVEVQDEIASDIARELELRIPAPAAQRVARPPNPQAYDLYLRALYLRDTFSPDALNQARQYLDRAIELDPNFAGAYSLKATVLGPTIYWRYIPLEVGVAEARAAITRALALDPGLAETYGALGMVKLFFDWDFPGAERALQRAVQLNPNDQHAWHHMGNYNRAIGRPLDAARARERAVRVDPLNVRMGVMLGDDYAAANRLDDAHAQFQRMQRLDPAHPLLLGTGPSTPSGPWLIYMKQARHQEVVDEYLRIGSMRRASTSELDVLRAAYRRGGLPAFWRSWLEFDLRHAGSNPDPVRMATFHALAGDTAQALQLLERAHAERNPAMIYVFFNPSFAALREHVRFRRIFRQMDLPGA